MSDSDVDTASQLSELPKIRRPQQDNLELPRNGAPQRNSVLSEGIPVTLRPDSQAFRRRSNERHSMHAGGLNDFTMRRSPKVESAKWTNMFTSKRIKKTIQKRFHGDSSVVKMRSY